MNPNETYAKFLDRVTAPVTRSHLYQAINEAAVTGYQRPGQAVWSRLPIDVCTTITEVRNAGASTDIDPYEIETVGNTYAWIDKWLVFNAADEVVGLNW